ncbi:hypothetical protein [Nocardiopsis baichengensis]|uniref:hypothetical protein n=1 Tax=Nocardiopsis baichengensis TaxID=280240 RepID=UPI00137701B1|nr:hypothetical protein [Nocardiopsis baichengensis]
MSASTKQPMTNQPPGLAGAAPSSGFTRTFSQRSGPFGVSTTPRPSGLSRMARRTGPSAEAS